MVMMTRTEAGTTMRMNEKMMSITKKRRRTLSKLAAWGTSGRQEEPFVRAAAGGVLVAGEV